MDNCAKYNLFCIMGKSGAGKSTYLDEIMKHIPELKPIIYCTTREKRENEVDGKDYYFYNESNYEELLCNPDKRVFYVTDDMNPYKHDIKLLPDLKTNSIIESRSYNVFENNKRKVVHYFTIKKSIPENDCICAISPYQYRSFISNPYMSSKYNMHIIYVYTSDKIRLQRLIDRCKNNDGILEICRRVVDETTEFNDVLKDYPEMYSLDNSFWINNNFNDIAFFNNNVSKACNYINDIIGGK